MKFNLVRNTPPSVDVTAELEADGFYRLRFNGKVVMSLGTSGYVHFYAHVAMAPHINAVQVYDKNELVWRTDERVP